MILDYIENIELPDNSDEHFFYVRNTLAQLANGLFFLNHYVSRLERDYLLKPDQDENDIQFVGNVVSKLPVGRLISMFQWYAVSACSYAQLVGWAEKRDPKSAIVYVKSVMPKLYKYRNKVAAHFALAKPRQDDNQTIREASVMTRIVCTKKHIILADITPNIEGENNNMSSDQDISWSLTKAHNTLISRYWPDGEPKFNAELMIPAGKTLSVKVNWSDSLK